MKRFLKKLGQLVCVLEGEDKMSIRLHLKGQKIPYLVEELHALTGVMIFDKKNEEATTFVKAENGSFYEVGSEGLYSIAKEDIKSHLEIDRYISGNPVFATVFKWEDIQTFLDNHENCIQATLADENIHKIPKLDMTKHLIKLYQFIVKHELELILK